MMDVSQFGRYLRDKEEIIARLDIKDRDLDLVPRKNIITTIIGPRRAGKTYLFYGKLKGLGHDKCLYLDFDDIELEDVSIEEVSQYIQFYEEITGSRPQTIFLDEIQNIPKWEMVVKEVFERKEMNIFITGSSSKLLAKDIATQLRGRGIKHLLLPLSFSEYLGFQDWKFKKVYSTSEESKIKGMLGNYLEAGSFPDIVLDPDIASKFYEEYIDLVIYRDLIERYGIKNLHLLKTLIRTILESYSKELSIHRLFNIIKSQGISVSKKTLYNYSEYLQDVMFSFYLRKFSYSQRTSDLSIPKVYLADTGLASFSRRFEIGRAMENSVYLDLKRQKDCDPNLELYYWSETNKEVDFLIRDGKGIRKLIQVTYRLTPENYNREINSLLKASEKLDCNDLLLINWDDEDILEIGARNIKVFPLWKWMLRQ